MCFLFFFLNRGIRLFFIRSLDFIPDKVLFYAIGLNNFLCILMIAHLRWQKQKQNHYSSVIYFYSQKISDLIIRQRLAQIMRIRTKMLRKKTTICNCASDRYWLVFIE